MARRIKRAQQQKLSKAEKKATRQQQLKKAAAIGGLLCLSPSFIFPPAAMAASFNVNDTTSLNAAMANTDPTLNITFTGDITATGNITSNTTATDITITGGDGATNYTINGGGLYSIFSFTNANPITLNMNNLTINSGRKISTNYGAGLYMQNMGGGLIAANTFSANTAYSGGAMYVENMAGGTLSANIFSANSATSGEGGGMYVQTMAGGTLSANTFGVNSAVSSGGGMYVNTMTGGTLSANTFRNNQTSDLGGGMCVETMSGDASIAGNSFSGNSANLGGGGMYVETMSGDASIAGNSFSGNSAFGGGGMYVYHMADNASISGNTFSANAGGGMYVNDMADNASIVGNIFNANDNSGMYVYHMADNASISGNTFSNTVGGGMYVYSMAGGSVSANSYINNSVSATGGIAQGAGMHAGYMDAGVSVAANSFFNNRISGADSGYGGGMYMSRIIDGELTGNSFFNNYVSANSRVLGGGIHVPTLSGGLVQDNIFSNNRAVKVAGSAYADAYGGGMYVYTAHGATIKNNIFSANLASFTTNLSNAQGGGVYVSHMSGGSVSNNIFNGNMVNGDSAFGGGMYAFLMSGVAIADNSFINNHASAAGSALGGGLHVSMMSGGSITGNIFSGNMVSGDSAFGGGMYTYSKTNVNININNNTFSANSAGGASAHGGGLYATVYYITLQDNVFADNQVSGTANAHGGGLYARTIVSGNLINNSFINNHASGVNAYGGALYTSAVIGSMVNNIFTNNSAAGYGGAIYYAAATAGNGTFNLSADAGGTAQFIGNQHQAGSAAYSPNSIYFATPPAGNGDRAVALNVDVNPTGTLLMQDPMMAQARTASESLTVNVTKTGAGVWQLGGHNDMQGPGAWNINAGTLRLIDDVNGSPAHIELSDAATASFSLGTNATLSLDGHSHKITANNITLANNATIEADGARLSTTQNALSLNAATALNLPGGITVNTTNAGALNGTYTIIEDNRNTDYTTKVTGLFDGNPGYAPTNDRYAPIATYILDSPGKVRIMAAGADIARNATWDNNSNDNLWNQTSENWVLTGHAAKVYKAGDSPIFTGSPDGTVKVDGPMDANVMTVQNGHYTFSPNNNAGDGIIGNRLNITGGQAAFDVPLDFSGSGAGSINVAGNAGMLLAPNSPLVKTGAFNLNGSLHVVPMAASPYTIDAASINFNPGSVVGVSGFSYGDRLTGSQYSVLSLVANSIINQSAIAQASGTVQVGIYDYDYSNLYWDGNRLMLVLQGNGPFDPNDPNNPNGPGTINQARRGDAAVTAPGVIMAQHTPGSWMMPRFNYTHSVKQNENVGQNLAAHMLNPGQWGGLSLDGEPDLLAARGLLLNNGAGMESGHSLGDTQPHMLLTTGSFNSPTWRANAAGGGDMLLGNGSLWFTPSYSYTDNSGRSGYNIKTPSWAGGYEQWFNNSFFLGLAVAGSLPEYKSHDADVDGKNISLALYGGLVLPWDMELGAFVTYGHTSYDQTRRVQGETYSSDYDSKNLGFGLNVGRDFVLDKSGLYVLRPFASYEYMHLDIDGYNEGNGRYALNMGGHKENLHFARVGVDTTATAKDSGAFVTGSVYYAGLYGDREAEAGAFFTNDPANPFTSVGDALDKHSLGLGVSAGLPLGDSVELQAGYNFMVGEDNKTHQGNLSILLKF